jgi:thiol-disulfide isomerase/thioredoxin
VRYLGIILALIGVVLAVTIGLRHRPLTPIFNPGNHPLAPEFSLTALDGQTIDLADYRGRVVLLDFWATWCGPCREEIPRFIQLQDKYRERGFQVIGISMDDEPELVREFYRRFRVNYPVALGGSKLGELYGGVLGLPIAFLVGRDGRIYAKHIGSSDPSILESEVAYLLSRSKD